MGNQSHLATSQTKKIYIKADMGIVAHFYDGKCDHILFRKMEENALGIPVEMSKNEIRLLLIANGGDMKWMEREGMNTTYVTEGGEIIAEYGRIGHSLFIATREAEKRFEETKKAEEAKKLGGF